MPPKGCSCSNAPRQNAKEYGVPKPLTEPEPPLVSGEAHKLRAFVGLVFAFAAVHHSVDGCITKNSNSNNSYTYDDGVVWHIFALLFFLCVPEVENT